MYPHVNVKENVDVEESDYSYMVDNTKKITWVDWILLNRPLKVIIALILTTIVAPLLIYRFLFFTSLELPPSDGLSFGSCLIPRHIRLLCGYGDVLAEGCHRDCCYDHHNNVCFHRFPSRFSYVLNGSWSEEVLLTSRIPRVPYGSQESFTNIRLSVDEVSSSHLSLTFYKSDKLITGRRIKEKKYVYDIGSNTNAVDELQVVVNTTHGNIFSTARGPLIASNNIWEIAFKITDDVMYGLGEIPLKKNTTKVIYSHKGGLSSIPLIYARLNGSFHGLLLDTIAPTEIYIGSENQLVVRSITNFGIKLHLFVGPKPVDIMKDVKQMIAGNKTFEYWMLGAHICSDIATNDSLSDLRSFISAASTASMPFESHCGVAPIVFNTECNRQSVTLVNNGITALRNAKKKFVPHVSPYINYTEPKSPEDDEFVPITPKLINNYRCFDDKEDVKYIIQEPKSEKMYFGVVNGHKVVYPKYDNISEEFMEKMWVHGDIDGVILENNWPLDESEKNVNEINRYLPYFSKQFQEAFNQTPQWNATTPKRYLDTHNQYGNEFAIALQKINLTVPTMSTSAWMNGNIVINRQDIETSWSSLQKELVAASLGGISGQWFWSSHICGDTANFYNVTQTRLCAKWYMAGTYFPMIKIHSKGVRRDPLAFVGTDRTHMISALNNRMRLLPYFYTVLQEGPLLRPMFYQFPSVKELANLTTQFSVGDDLLIVPNLQPSQSHVHFWMPPGQWYELWGGLKIEGNTGEAYTMTTTEADFLTLIRGGSIILTNEETKLTVEETRRSSPLIVTIALHCETRNVSEGTTVADTEIFPPPIDNNKTTTAKPTITSCSANGKLYVTPNMTLLFEADEESLTITAKGNDFETFCNDSKRIISQEIWYILIFGLDKDKNNADNYRRLMTDIDLCDLETDDEIIYNLID